MSTTVIVTEKNRARDWQAVLGTTVVPVVSLTPQNLTIQNGQGKVTRTFYQVDLTALTPEQMQRLTAQKAAEWDCGQGHALHLLESIGIVIQEEHCQPAPPPQVERHKRIGEYEIPPHATPDTCYSCGAPIMWITTKNHNNMPLSVRTIEQDGGGRRFALSHYADCPHAKEHRGRTRKENRQARGRR